MRLRQIRYGERKEKAKLLANIYEIGPIFYSEAETCLPFTDKKCYATLEKSVLVFAPTLSH